MDSSYLSDKEHDELVELLKDAESCARLSKWEENFLDDMQTKVLLYKKGAMVSDKQWEVLKRIESKVYA